MILAVLILEMQRERDANKQRKDQQNGQREVEESGLGYENEGQTHNALD